MGWLIAAGIISLVFGILLLLPKEILQGLGQVLNRVVVVINGIFSPIRVPAGIVLVIVGGWLIWVAFSYADLWYLHIIGWLALICGLLYLFVPGWLEALSKACNQVILSTDEVVIGSRVVVGIILLLAAIYIFFSAYFLR